MRARPADVEVAEDEAFTRVVARSQRRRSTPQTGWTARVLVGNLKPSTLYWYRFTDADGNGSRVGRTMTAPAPRRCAAGEIRLRLLPEHQHGLSASLAADDP